jgi:hypothetical protein
LPELLDLLRCVSELCEDCVCILAEVWNFVHPRLYAIETDGRQQGLQGACRRSDIARAASPGMLRVRQQILYRIRVRVSDTRALETLPSLLQS